MMPFAAKSPLLIVEINMLVPVHFAPNDPDVAREVLVHLNPRGGSMF